MKAYVWFDVERFVRNELAVSPRKPITPETRLEDDLDISGDHADVFMDRFFLRFGVDPGDYSFNRYFVSEGAGLKWVLTPFARKRREKSQRVPLTVGMLASAARGGRWESQWLEGLRTR